MSYRHVLILSLACCLWTENLLAQSGKSQGTKPTATKPATKPSAKSSSKKGATARTETSKFDPELWKPHQDFLLEGVTEIKISGAPGTILPYGPEAFPVVVSTNKGKTSVAAAAAEFGKGRVVAFCHNDLLGSGPANHTMTGRFISNCIAWAGHKEKAPGTVKVAVMGKRNLFQQLQSAKIAAIEVGGKNWLAQTRGADVIIAETDGLADDELRGLEAFVKDGGGLISVTLIWAWQQYGKGGNAATDNQSNKLFSKAGIVWLDATQEGQDEIFKVINPVPKFSNAGYATQHLKDALETKVPPTAEEMAMIASTLEPALVGIPWKMDHGVVAQLIAFVEDLKKQIPVPTSKQPVKAKQADAKLLVGLQTGYYLQLPLEEMKPAPTASVFPGAVPANAKKVTRKVIINTETTRWKSTGLYAAPGTLVKVKVPRNIVGQKFEIQIGSHSDSLWSKDEWKRPPAVIRQFPIDKVEFEVGNAYGGLIYVVVPEKTPAGKFEVEFSNVVDAPYFVHGETDISDWRFTIRNYPAPWAELETRHLVITVPSELVRKLDFPDKLMNHWAAVLDACADLYSISRNRPYAERFVFDDQISAGFMHSGYPIMCFTNPSAPEVVDLNFLENKGGWGFYHELGHNHQKGDWTFQGTGEVTNNLTPLYVIDTLTPKAFSHDAIQQPERDNRERKYVTNGAPFSTWQEDPFLALTMYIQLKEQFGWQPFRDVFLEYEKLQKDERPKSEMDKRDQWMMRFSRKVNRNLGPFFQYWGVPTSENARQMIKDLPTWMPPGRPGSQT
ncbi:hypothetical protein Spb1_28960 [Planctopirus ephydatiae]|uniref:Peptidase M60 domain-containing protein n=1 Tax=Planctopirus ephydatiae TaxID=2528019 RepID=A0A518GQV1_9PLAN|nr:M60 family metallopeptidase [Planctopirus ephydatiae]QDV30960.1 hypothetical protein Spb1_28960 [Planctopirus ephydatiae]